MSTRVVYILSEARHPFTYSTFNLPKQDFFVIYNRCSLARRCRGGGWLKVGKSWQVSNKSNSRMKRKLKNRHLIGAVIEGEIYNELEVPPSKGEYRISMYVRLEGFARRPNDICTKT
jgi:hypothetical protein